MFRKRILVTLAALPALALAQTQPATKPANAVVSAAATPAQAATPSRPTRLEDIDTNHDGFVSREEFMAEEKKRFAEFDMNHDGKIDANEIAKSPPLMERNLRTANGFVKQWDANGDGIVSADEFQKFVNDRFTKEDKQGTGKIPAHPRPAAPNPKPGVPVIQPVPPPKKN